MAGSGQLCVFVCCDGTSLAVGYLFVRMRTGGRVAVWTADSVFGAPDRQAVWILCVDPHHATRMLLRCLLHSDGGFQTPLCRDANTVRAHIP
jgi:hypothetical protein